jgi:hypothetical protein
MQSRILIQTYEDDSSISILHRVDREDQFKGDYKPLEPYLREQVIILLSKLQKNKNWVYTANTVK